MSLPSHTVDELALFQKIREDDAGAFKILFIRYYEKLCGFVRLIQKDEFSAEEVVQEVFTRIWEKRKEITIQSSVKYYLYISCRNQALNIVSKHQHQPLAFSEISVADFMIEDDPEKIFSRNALQEDVYSAIDSLPAKAREVLILKYFQKARHKEIAQRMNISESMVEKHAANALRHLRKKLAMHTISVFFALFLKFSLLILLLS
jgi:RNA polymerase sigma-70 factor, ECF subfamily